MITIDQAIKLCVLRIVNPDKGTHSNYKRVTELAELYEQLITGEEQTDLIKQYFKGESAEQIEKIEKITNSITGTVCNSLMSAFKKVGRTKPIVKKLDFKESTDEKKAALLAALNNYYAGASLENFITTRFDDLSFLDPNAFILAEFVADKDNIVKPSPYPFEVSSEEAINYSFDKGILQFLLVERELMFDTTKGPTEGVKLYIYLNDHAITFTQVEKTSKAAIDQTKKHELLTANVKIETRNGDRFVEEILTLPVTMITDNKQFEIAYYTHKHNRVPAEIVGYIPDKATDGESYVNPFHYGAVPYLKKSIKSVCEMDLTMHSHTFPQKLMYAEGCSFSADNVCSKSNQRADKCTLCGAKGFLAHKSAKDIQTMELPRDPKDIIPLSELIYYAYPPIDGIKFQDEYIRGLRQDCYKGVFNSEVFAKDEVATTATGKNLDLQNVYDTLSDYATKRADFWVKTVQMVAVILDYKDVIAQLVYPNDFKLKSVTDLLTDLKTANDSGAPAFVCSELNRDIASQLYQDRPDEFKKYEVKQRLAPFTGKQPSEIALLLVSDDVQRLDKVTFNYFEQFLEELEEDSLKANTGFADLLDEPLKATLDIAVKAGLIWFYDMPFAIQKALLQAKARLKLDLITNETPAVVPFTQPTNA